MNIGKTQFWKIDTAVLLWRKVTTIHFNSLVSDNNNFCKLTRNSLFVISARPQRQTNNKGCRIFGDLDQLKSILCKKTAVQLYNCTCFNFIAVLFLFLSSSWGSVYRFLHSIFLILTDPGLQRSGTLLHCFVVVVLPILEDLFASNNRLALTGPRAFSWFFTAPQTSQTHDSRIRSN